MTIIYWPIKWQYVLLDIIDTFNDIYDDNGPVPNPQWFFLST